MKLDIRDPQQDVTIFESPLHIQVPYTAENYAALKNIPNTGEVRVRGNARPVQGLLDKLFGLMGFVRQTADTDEGMVPYYGYQIMGNEQGGAIHLRLHHLPQLDTQQPLNPDHTIGMVHLPEPS